jgi:hypothetical protein
VGPRTGRDNVEKRKITPRTGLEIETLGLPASSNRHTDCIIPAIIQDVKLKKKSTINFHYVRAMKSSIEQNDVDVIIILIKLSV